MQKNQSFLRKVCVFLITLLIVSSSFSLAVKANPPIETGVFLSEINFLGSGYSSGDEWIELYNSSAQSIELEGYSLYINSSKELKLSGIINSKSYFIISRFVENDPNSSLKIKPDLVIKDLSLRNSDLQIEIKRIEEPVSIDQITFGKNTQTNNPAGGRYSFARNSFDTTSLDFNKWKPSVSSKNLKSPKTNANRCTIDFATPGGENFPQGNTEMVFEAENLCYSAGEIVTGEANTYLKVQNFKGNLFQFNVDLENGAFGTELFGKSSQEKHFSIGNLEIQNGSKKFKSGNINSKSFNNLGKADIKFRNSRSQNIQISFDTDLSKDQIIFIDKIIINEVSPSNLRSIKRHANEINWSKTPEFINPQTALFTSAQIKESGLLAEGIYFTEGVISSSTVPFITSVDFEVQNLSPDTNLLDSILEIKLENPFSEKVFSKSLKKYELEESSRIWLGHIPQKEGAYILSINAFGNADILIKEINYSEVSRGIQNTFPEISHFEGVKDKSQIKNINNSFVELNNAKGKIFELPKSNYCLLSGICDIELSIESIDNNLPQNEKILSIFWGAEQGDRDVMIEHFEAKDFVNNKIKISLQNISNENPQNKLVIFSHIKGNFRIYRPEFKQTQNKNNSLKSLNNIDWEKQYKLETNTAKGQNGQLIDILSSDTLKPQKYNLNFKLKKLEDFDSGKDLLRIRIIDQRGMKLAEKLIDENDLKYLESNQIALPFELKKSGKIYIQINFIGNHEGGQADLEVGGIKLL